MKKLFFCLVSTVCAMFLIASCGPPKNTLSLYKRSIVVNNDFDEDFILLRASLKKLGPEVGGLRILNLNGTPYEMGFQHGRFLKNEIHKLYNRIYFIVSIFASDEMMDEIYDLMEPYIPIEEKEEMRGLAHGANISLRLVHWVHCIPEVSEYGPKKRFRTKFKATSCSNITAFGKATVDGELYHMRVLDWIRELGAQQWPVVLVHHPYNGNASATFSYAGFIGAVSGMNDKHMSFGEMGYGDPPGESLEGIPFIFLFRKLMREANNIDDAVRIIKSSKRTCSYVYMFTDAKAKDDSKKAAIVISDKDRVLVFRENTRLVDERGGEEYPAVDDMVYGGAKDDELIKSIKKYYGKFSEKALMETCGPISLGGNMQNVIFKPGTLEAWVSNAGNSARDEGGKACYQKWYHLDFSSVF